MKEISISESVRRQLRSALLEQGDLVDSVRRHPQTSTSQPGSYRCVCEVAVRRPFDPETAEIKKLEVTIQRMEKGWLITRVDGLGEGIETGGLGEDGI